MSDFNRLQQGLQQGGATSTATFSCNLCNLKCNHL